MGHLLTAPHLYSAIITAAEDADVVKYPWGGLRFWGLWPCYLAAAIWLAPGLVTGLRECPYCRSQWNVRTAMSVEDDGCVWWCPGCHYTPM